MNENIKLYAPILVICTLLLGLALIARTEDYYLIVFYPLFVALFLFGFLMIKYRPTQLMDLENEILKKELMLSVVIALSILILLKMGRGWLLSYRIILVLIFGLSILNIVIVADRIKKDVKK